MIWPTFLNLISACSLNSAELCDVGNAKFPIAKSPKIKNVLFQLLLGHLTDLHQTLQVASVDKTKSSSHHKFHIKFAIYSKLLKHVEGVALNTSTWQIHTAACPDMRGLQRTVHYCLQLQFFTYFLKYFTILLSPHIITVYISLGEI